MTMVVKAGGGGGILSLKELVSPWGRHLFPAGYRDGADSNPGAVPRSNPGLSPNEIGVCIIGIKRGQSGVQLWDSPGFTMCPVPNNILII